MRRFAALLSSSVLVLGLATPVGAAAPEPPVSAPPVTAMTLNLYAGANLFRLLEPVPDCAAAPDPPGPEICSLIVQGGATLAEADATDFESRAVALARIIRQRQPDVVGLQEVSRLTRIPTDPFGTPVGPPQVTDYLETLLATLNERGPGYEVAAVAVNLETPFMPAGVLVPASGPVVEELVSLVDRNVILVRSDVEYAPASAVGAAYESAQLTIDFADVEIEFTRGYTRVVVMVRGTPLTVVNTHLEVQFTDPAFVPANAIQTAQAAELMDLLAAEDGPIVLTGDFNSDPAADNGLNGVPTPYEVIAASGFVDAWTLRRGSVRPGFTCCQASDLSNRRSSHDERLDIVWFRSAAGAPHLVWVRTTGDRHKDKTPSGLWPSDHAGVVARMLLPG